ncbi:MAG: hypothetical protein E7Z74_06890 [Methanobrevibacter millerae]|uniref:Uncharacterized protein n=1 Tax=Methanobrevibacter millerae TaxID=230361 RepID=A0A8T3VSE7_9EURY|nr:hypothetical protein [Methanobrevibacter millerae]
MRKLIIIILALVIFIPVASAQNVTINGVDFQIPQQYEHGTVKESSYVYQSGFTFRILSLDDYKNLRLNYGDDIVNAKSAQHTSIAGHDAVVIPNKYQSKDYTTVYFATADKIFLVCFNDTYVNDDITNMIANTPAQTMSANDFANQLNSALEDYKQQLSDKEAQLEYEDYQRSNKPTTRYYFFWL